MKWLHYLFIVSLLLFSCKGQNVKNKRPTRLLIDALQREVAAARYDPSTGLYPALPRSGWLLMREEPR